MARGKLIIEGGKSAFAIGRAALKKLGSLARGGPSTKQAKKAFIPSTPGAPKAAPKTTTSARRTGLFRPGGFLSPRDDKGNISLLRVAGLAGGGLFGAQIGSEALRTVTGQGVGERVAGLLGGPAQEDEAELLERLAALEEEGLLEEGRRAESTLFRQQVGTPFEQRFGTIDQRASEVAFLEQIALPAATDIGVSLSDLLGDIGRGSPFLHNLTAGERARLAAASQTTGPVSAPQKSAGNAELSLQAGLAGQGG